MKLPTSSSGVTSLNAGIYPLIFVTLSFKYCL